MTEKKPNTLIGLDNIQRNTKDEENLNTLFYKMFNTAGGSEILKYLKKLTLDAVEGQRYLVGLIQRRVNKGVSQNMVKENNNE